MFGHKPRWMRAGNFVINLDHVDYFARRDPNIVEVFSFKQLNPQFVLEGVTLDDIHYFLKHGKPRKRKAAK
jgi:hypothetical protein